MSEAEAVAWSRAIQIDRAIAWRWRTVKQHLLDTDVVVKPFEMTQPRRSAGDMQMQRRCAVS
jgi:hypothetical protein